ncbi:MAG: hypothetical protein Q7S76_02165 [bacterium]|nr:hypothetical protein [bacterium]
MPRKTKRQKIRSDKRTIPPLSPVSSHQPREFSADVQPLRNSYTITIPTSAPISKDDASELRAVRRDLVKTIFLALGIIGAELVLSVKL